MKIAIGLITAGSLMIGAATRAQSAPDLVPTTKTLVQLLDDGWQVRNGQIDSVVRGIVVFLVKGQSFAYCVATDSDAKTGNRTSAGLTSSCVVTVR